MNLERIKQLAQEILVELDAGGVTIPPTPTTPPNEEWRNETGWPLAKTFGRATFNMTAPTNPLWKPSVEAEVFGSQGAHLADPGAPSGSRSPAGFPTAGGRVQWGGQTFDNDEQVWTAIRSELSPAEIQAQWDIWAENFKKARGG